MMEPPERIDRSGIDIVLLKTFLEVARTGHFGKTAEILFITQSAVSARIKLLEATLGVALFTRRRHEIRLTPPGHRLHPHAEAIVRSWSQARAEVARTARLAHSVTVGAQADLWPILVRRWGLAWRRVRPGLVLGIEILPAPTLIEGLAAERLDLAFLFEPPSSSQLSCEPVMRIPLILVGTRAGLVAEQAVGAADYLFVSWGQAFEAGHARHFPGLASPAWRLSQGTLALDLLRETGGSAYLPEPVVTEALACGTLFRVAEAPLFACQTYVAWNPQVADPALIDEALGLLRNLG